jgi:hypothetical protein
MSLESIFIIEEALAKSYDEERLKVSLNNDLAIRPQGIATAAGSNLVTPS